MKRFVVAIIATILLFMAAGSSHATASFPIKISQDRRIFEDATGKPFLLHGDTAWSLIAELKREDVEDYLQDRRKRGFNAILVNLVEHQFSRHPPANAYGEKPFNGEAFVDLNPKYFDHAAWVIERAQQLGFVVLLAPAYLGVSGGDQGWFRDIEAAGPEKMRLYGQKVAERFRQYPNIVWVFGGDFNTPDENLVSSMAEGIMKISPSSLKTVHPSPETSTAEIWGKENWFSFDTLYSYKDVHAGMLKRTAEDTAMPVILLETFYEKEWESTPQTIRRNAYGALLAGAAGQFFGNNPIWHFSSSGLFAYDGTWPDALNSPGARSMAIMKALFGKLPWPQLQPDRQRRIVVNPESYGSSLSDGTLSVIYGDADGFAVQKDVVRQGWQAVWFDPVSGSFADAVQPEVDASIAIYTPRQSKNAGGGTDWLLLIGSNERLQPIQKR
ncbi:DUF4038 domain-containing protein [Brucella sp. JSBI001]|jgi:Protein of unknown function (DUF4038)|uniref:apiosidase-like domain-containing protein n=1 Tax=Brucella sp. JSBI001 TaxID=2886044 RepID=UPI00222F4268|nr:MULTISPECIES: DUF4038 domain-containing protein [Brucella]UZD71187.1 DUF4038 domain-containing protein [Brucella sp. JSBI001]